MAKDVDIGGKKLGPINAVYNSTYHILGTVPGTGDAELSIGDIASALMELAVDWGSHTLINTMREDKRMLRRQTLEKHFSNLGDQGRLPWGNDT